MITCITEKVPSGRNDRRFSRFQTATAIEHISTSKIIFILYTYKRLMGTQKIDRRFMFEKQTEYNLKDYGTNAEKESDLAFTK